MKKFKVTKSITNRESESLEKYFREISKVPRITADEEIELTKRIKENDRSALERLTKANLRFVVSVAKQYQGQGLPLSDLINDGNIGLIKAAERFDETRGFKFISYAVWWIRQSILASLADNSRLVSIPVNKVGTASKISKVQAQLEQDLQREPTAEEIAEVLELTKEDVDSTIIYNTRHVSIDEPLQQEDECSLADLLEDTNIESVDKGLNHTESLRKEIQMVFSVLDDRESRILQLHFGIGGGYPLSLEDIADEFGLTKERVRQLKESALRKLRKSDKSDLLKTFLS